MKKFFVTVFVAFAVIVSCGQGNRAEAYDYYLGDYHTGLKAYVMTETLEFQSSFTFQATVKAVNSSGKVVDSITYYFDGGAGQPPTYSNSQGYSGLVREGNISRKLYEYARKVYAEQVMSRRP